jgi:hypothetical protein
MEIALMAEVNSLLIRCENSRSSRLASEEDRSDDGNYRLGFHCCLGSSVNQHIALRFWIDFVSFHRKLFIGTSTTTPAPGADVLRRATAGACRP